MEPGEQEQSTKPVERWEYENQFRQYLLLLARKGKDGLETTQHYPKRIELSSAWHETLDKMRQETRDHKERFALIGTQEDQSIVKLQTVFGVGTADVISVDLQEAQIKKAQKRAGIVRIIGDIHSHSKNPLIAKINQVPVVKWLNGPLPEGFSPGDFLGMLTPHRFMPVMGMVSEYGNYFAFKTRETRDVPVHSPLSSLNAFNKYWYGQFPEKGGEWGEALSQLNNALAAHHRLVLYHGDAGKNLIRTYPNQ